MKKSKIYLVNDKRKLFKNHLDTEKKNKYLNNLRKDNIDSWNLSRLKKIIFSNFLLLRTLKYGGTYVNGSNNSVNTNSVNH